MKNKLKNFLEIFLFIGAIAVLLFILALCIETSLHKCRQQAMNRHQFRECMGI